MRIHLTVLPVLHGLFTRYSNAFGDQLKFVRKEIMKEILDSKYHPQLYPFEVAFFLEDTEPDIKPFGYLDIPAVKATANAALARMSGRAFTRQPSGQQNERTTHD